MITPDKEPDILAAQVSSQNPVKRKPIAPESRPIPINSGTDKEQQDMMIVQTPNDDDILLGQGHYRHHGNKKLNQVVDAKVDEYKNQSRVFKTYMAHDIINRMRSKGVRFLKELAPHGWIVVKDDKEAREKVAQRFQYMMRKQAEAAKASANANTKPKAPNSVPRSVLNWNGISVKVPFLPVFHQLQKSSVMVDDNINEISGRLIECFDMIGVQSCFNYEEANSILTAKDNLKMQLNLWKPLGGNRGVIVELENLEGDVLALQKYNRYILEAATGLFDRYKHNLFQSGATSSVKDHVTAFTSTLGSAKHSSDKCREQLSARAGMTKGLSDRALQDGKRKLPFVRGEQLEHPTKGPSVKRFEHSGLLPLASGASKLVPIAPRDPKLVPIAPRPPPPPKLVPLAPKVAPQKREPEGNSETSSTTGSFASAFSRWETGGDAADNSMCRAAGQVNARKPCTTPARTYPAEAWNQGPGVARQRDMKPNEGAQPARAVPFQPLKSHVPSFIGDIRNNAASDTFREPCARERAEEPRFATVFSAKTSWVAPDTSLQRNNFTATNSTAASFPHYSTQNVSANERAYEPLPSSLAIKPGHEAKDVDGDADNRLDSAQETYEPLQCPVTIKSGHGTNVVDSDADHHLDCSASSQEQKTPAFDRWSTAVGPAEEMKCDSSVDDKVDAEMFDQAIETIKRLSISSSDASFVDSRTNVGRMPRALSNQEMKCDSSFDDEPYEGSDLLFIPSSFFGNSVHNANFMHRAPNPPSPAHSFCSHFSVEMRSIPSPSPSSSSHVSIEFSLPSPCGSFSSRCSLEVNSLKHARMDEALSPSVFQSDQCAQDKQEDGVQALCKDEAKAQNSVPPAIFVDSTSSIDGHAA